MAEKAELSECADKAGAEVLGLKVEVDKVRGHRVPSSTPFQKRLCYSLASKKIIHFSKNLQKQKMREKSKC
jgi:hypothetical protein